MCVACCTGVDTLDQKKGGNKRRSCGNDKWQWDSFTIEIYAIFLETQNGHWKRQQKQLNLILSRKKKERLPHEVKTKKIRRHRHTISELLSNHSQVGGRKLKVYLNFDLESATKSLSMFGN